MKKSNASSIYIIYILYDTMYVLYYRIVLLTFSSVPVLGRKILKSIIVVHTYNLCIHVQCSTKVSTVIALPTMRCERGHVSWQLNSYYGVGYGDNARSSQ